MILEHDTLIAAPTASVWDATLDVERWPDWNPNVTAVRRLGDGPLGVGAEVEIRQPGMGAVVWTVTELVSPHRFTWRGRATGMSMVATHELSPEDGGTRNRLRIEITGWAARLFAPLVRRAVATALERENEGLRSRCESGAQIS